MMNSEQLIFLKACFAYIHITIPSLEDFLVQFKLYILTAQQALICTFINETDSLLRQAIQLIPNIHNSPENQL